MFKPWVCHFMQLSGVVMLMDFSISLLIRASWSFTLGLTGSQGTALRVLAPDGFHM